MTDTFTRRQNPARWAYRWFAGRPLDGRNRTDATFLKPGTRSVYPRQLRSWSFLAGWKRSAWRQVVLFVLVAGPVGWFTHRQALLVTVAVAGPAAVGVLVWRGWRAWQIREHHRRYVRPLHLAAANYLQMPPTVRTSDYLDVPLSFATSEDTPAVVKLPPEWVPSETHRKALSELVLAKLGQSANTVDATFRTMGQPTLTVRLAPQPPDYVSWGELEQDMLSCAPGDVVLGVGARAKTYRATFNGLDDPHWGFSVASGRGKSTMLLGTAAQILRQDPAARVDAVDPKMTSLAALIGVPGFAVANDPSNVQGMWDLIRGVRAELGQRMAHRAEDPTVEFPMRLLLVDELNQFAEMTSAHWRSIKEASDPAVAPIWKTFAEVLWMGREFRCHAVMVGQRMDNRATGGFGLRDSLGFRGLAGFRPNQWKMLIGTTPVPASQKRRGRWIYVADGSTSWVQNVHGTPQQLRDWALGRSMSQSHIPASTQVDGVVRQDVRQDAGWVVGYDAAAEYTGLTVDALRQRVTRRTLLVDGRQGNRPSWRPETLDAVRETSGVR